MNGLPCRNRARKGILSMDPCSLWIQFDGQGEPVVGAARFWEVKMQLTDCCPGNPFTSLDPGEETAEGSALLRLWSLRIKTFRGPMKEPSTWIYEGAQGDKATAAHKTSTVHFI